MFIKLVILFIVKSLAFSQSIQINEIVSSNQSTYYDEDGDNTFDRFVTDYEVKQFTKEDGTVVEYRDMHSLSVGDIVRDHSTDTYHIVDSFGFKEVDVA